MKVGLKADPINGRHSWANAAMKHWNMRAKHSLCIFSDRFLLHYVIHSCLIELASDRSITTEVVTGVRPSLLSRVQRGMP